MNNSESIIAPVNKKNQEENVPMFEYLQGIRNVIYQGLVHQLNINQQLKMTNKTQKIQCIKLSQQIQAKKQEISEQDEQIFENHNGFVKLQQQQINNNENICNNNKHKLKNDTKNITKNYGKAIIAFILQNQKLVAKLIKNQNVEYKKLVQTLKIKKKCINTIAGLRELWLEEQFIYGKLMRKISIFFMRKYSLKYIFRSRITDYQGHIKYRVRIIQALRDPRSFTALKID